MDKREMPGKSAAAMTAFLLLFAVPSGVSWGQTAVEAEATASDLVTQARKLKSQPRKESPVPEETSAAEQKVVPGITMEFYEKVAMFSHTAIRIKTEEASFWQLELQDKHEYQRILDPHFQKLGIKLQQRGIPSHLGDAIIYRDAAERKTVEEVSRHQASAEICIDGSAPQRALTDYAACLEEGARGYVDKAFQYDVLVNNCSHFAEKLLRLCGLAKCSPYPYSTGVFHRSP